MALATEIAGVATTWPNSLTHMRIDPLTLDDAVAQAAFTGVITIDAGEQDRVIAEILRSYEWNTTLLEQLGG